MSSFNPNISEGTCYFDDSGNEAPSRYIPCGNFEGGHVPCCESQDNCLSSRACYNPQFGVTYLAGCTDKSYKDGTCPYKGDFANQPWVGLVYCNGTSNEWTGCHEKDNADTVSVPEPCWCPKTSRIVLFEDASRLTDLMSLPTGIGASIKWLGDYGPSAPPSAPAQTTHGSTSATSSDPSSSSPDASISVPSITSLANATSALTSPSPTSDQSTVLSTGSKVGIGVGAGVGGFALLVLLALLVRWLYGNKEKQRAQEQEKGDSTAAEHGSQQGNGELRSPAWSGHKSELPGNEMAPSPRRTDFGSKSEFEGSPAIGSVGRPISGGYEMPGKPGTMYEMPG